MARNLDATARDDRILPLTRALCWVIPPFLVVAFVVLYPWPSDTDRWFAWRILPTITPMVLGSAYLGGAYFFVRAIGATGWHTVKAGFVPVGVFASLMGITTILHWGKFNHGHVAFWLWVLLYFTTPFLVFYVWLRNRPYDLPVADDDLLLPQVIARIIGAVGVLAVVTGLFLFLWPAKAITFWPWLITPLTARVLGAIYCLGIAGTGTFFDRRWSSARLSFQVAVAMLVLILVAGLRARAEFDPGNVLTWMFLGGFVAVTICVAAVYWRMERLRVG